MALTHKEKNDVYMTVSIELQRMMEILSYSCARPNETEKKKLIADIEKSFRANWEIFKLS